MLRYNFYDRPVDVSNYYFTGSCWNWMEWRRWYSFNMTKYRRGRGAAVGQWLFVSSPSPRTRVLAFEPRPSVHPCVGLGTPIRLTNLWRSIHGSSSLRFPFGGMEENKMFCDCGACRTWPGSRVVGPRTTWAPSHDEPWIRQREPTAVTAPHSAGFPRKRASRRQWADGTCGKHCTPLQG